MNFNNLSDIITQTHNMLQNSASHAINKLLTVRNWLVGYYIVHFEQNGEDRSKYGDTILKKLADKLKIKGFSETNLKLNRQFYLTYPQISQSLTDQLLEQLQHIDNKDVIKGQSAIALSDVYQFAVSPQKLFDRLSFTHFVQLLSIKEPLKRVFYEIESIKGNWSVRELKRQINSLYYERSGLSKKPEKLAELTQSKIQPARPHDIVKNVYAFEFLGLPVKDALEETDLESALLDNLSDFILELGYGFCLEARQKRILIGKEYYFIDLVFFHRILKCHVLIELKVDDFNHVNAGQLNTYLNYFKEEIMEPGDNPPVGILLVTDKDHALVHYATANMDENLFVQKYMLKLPNKELLEKHIIEELKKLL